MNHSFVFATLLFLLYFSNMSNSPAHRAYLPSLPSAAEIGIDALRQRFEDELAASPNEEHFGDHTWRNMRLGSYRFEMGLAAPDSQSAEEHFAIALNYSDQAKRDQSGPLIPAIEASLMEIYLSRFRSLDPISNERRHTREELGRILITAQRAPIHGMGHHIHYPRLPDHVPCFPAEGERKNIFARLAFLLLCERAEMNILPASYRESNEPGPDAKHHHNTYFPEGREKRVPIRATFDKVSSHRSPDILYIGYRGLIGAARNRIEQTNLGRRTKKELKRIPDLAEASIDWLALWATGQQKTLDTQRHLFRAMKEEIIARRDNYLSSHPKTY
ncbi:MAG: hypothetical protein JWL85_1021 [Candidatus Saccharibacteria bacterium]|nr:hypothetical protein [Candidatus Saccharibacteria bacterium]